MVELGIILLVLGAVGAIACHFARIPVGIKIGLGTAVLGGALILLGYLLPALGGHEYATPASDHQGEIVR
jgi:hypothetical protein